jgi:cytoskeletal protein RodZ
LVGKIKLIATWGDQMNLGELLSAARNSAGLSLDELSAITSIRAGLLSEMERNNFVHCGGDIYARGHLRNIAPKIGLDASKLIEIYDAEHALENRSINEMLVESNVTKVPQEKRNLSWKVPAAGSLVIVLIFLVIQIVVTNVNSENTSPVAVQSQSPSPEPTRSMTNETETVTPQSGTGVDLTIAAVRGSSRIDIVIDGVHVDKGIILQGESKSFTSDTSISIYFSNPAGLDVTLNGELLPPLGGQNEEVRRTFR